MEGAKSMRRADPLAPPAPTPPDASVAHWYCIHSKPAQEQYARLHLERQRIPVFLPLARTQRVYRRRRQWIVRPLFPRYLFARFDAEQDGLRVRSTRGVAALVAFGGRPTPVPPGIVEELRRRGRDDVVTLEPEPLRVGERVAILRGPYAGLSAVFDRRARAADRVIVLLDLMASVARLEIGRDWLAREA